MLSRAIWLALLRVWPVVMPVAAADELTAALLLGRGSTALLDCVLRDEPRTSAGLLIEGWVRPLDGTAQWLLSGYGGPLEASALLYRLELANTRAGLRLQFTAGDRDGAARVSVTSSRLWFEDGGWHHVAGLLARDSAGRLMAELLFDGSSHGTAEESGVVLDGLGEPRAAGGFLPAARALLLGQSAPGIALMLRQVRVVAVRREGADRRAVLRTLARAAELAWRAGACRSAGDAWGIVDRGEPPRPLAADASDGWPVVVHHWPLSGDLLDRIAGGGAARPPPSAEFARVVDSECLARARVHHEPPRVLSSVEDVGPDSAARALEGSPAVHVIVFSPLDAATYDVYWRLYIDWIVTVLLRSVGRPVRVLLRRCDAGARDGPSACALALNRSIVVANAHALPLFRMREYVEAARSRGVTHVGLLHTNHERPWLRDVPLPALSPSERRDALPSLDAEYAPWDYVLRQYFDRDLRASSKYVPLGPAYLGDMQSHADVIFEYERSRLGGSNHTTMPASRRSRLCFFAGEQRADRATLLDIRNHHRLPCSISLLEPLQPDPARLSRRDYVAALRDSVVVLCPTGNAAETFRLWETLEAGAIPVTLEPGAERDFFAELAVPLACPIPRLASWEELPALLRQLDMNASRADELQARISHWYAQYLHYTASDIAQLIGRF